MPRRCSKAKDTPISYKKGKIFAEPLIFAAFLILFGFNRLIVALSAMRVFWMRDRLLFEVQLSKGKGADECRGLFAMLHGCCLEILLSNQGDIAIAAMDGALKLPDAPPGYVGFFLIIGAGEAAIDP